MRTQLMIVFEVDRCNNPFVSFLCDNKLCHTTCYLYCVCFLFLGRLTRNLSCLCLSSLSSFRQPCFLLFFFNSPSGAITLESYSCWCISSFFLGTKGCCPFYGETTYGCIFVVKAICYFLVVKYHVNKRYMMATDFLAATLSISYAFILKEHQDVILCQDHLQIHYHFQLHHVTRTKTGRLHNQGSMKKVRSKPLLQQQAAVACRTWVQYWPHS